MKGKALKLKGQRFGRLTVIRELTERKKGKVCWLCKCDCGNITEVRGHDLMYGDIKSCGCLRRELTGEKSLKHGHTVNRNVRHRRRFPPL